MADSTRPPVGSVAEEAARLLDALGGWAATAGYAAPPGGTAEASGDQANEPADQGAAPEEHDAGHCPTCGADRRTGEAVACQLCPVCQGIALLRSVRPETVDRLADLAAAVAQSLREMAEHRRHSGAGGGDAAPRHTQPARGRPRVQDIEVREEAGP